MPCFCSEYAKQCKEQLEDSSSGRAPPVFTLVRLSTMLLSTIDVSERATTEASRALLQHTTNLLEKYSGAWALVASYCLNRGPADVVCRNWNLLVAARAMAAHQSQYVWYAYEGTLERYRSRMRNRGDYGTCMCRYRRLFIWMSRYSYVNVFNRLSA